MNAKACRDCGRPKDRDGYRLCSECTERRQLRTGDSQLTEVGVACGVCGKGPVYFEACAAHEWATASECQSCGERYVIGPCRDCGSQPTETNR